MTFNELLEANGIIPAETRYLNTYGFEVPVEEVERLCTEAGIEMPIIEEESDHGEEEEG